MECRYCFIDREHLDMSDEVLYDAIDFLFTSPEQDKELQFCGGEPLLRFDLIRKAISYGEKKSKQIKKDIKFILTTNGILLDEEKVDFLKKHRVSILFSFDGLRITQMENRPLFNNIKNEIFDLIINNLKTLIKKRVKFFVNMVFSPKNLKHLKDNFDYIISLGVRNIQLCYAIGADFRNNDLLFCLEQLKEIIRIAREKNINLYNLNFNNEPVFASPQISVDSNGKIYVGCSFVLERIFPKLNHLFLVGNLKSMKNICSLKRTREEQLKIIMENKEKFDPRLLRNIYFGLELRTFFKNNFYLQAVFDVKNDC